MYYSGEVTKPSDYQHGQNWHWKLHDQRISNNDFKTLEDIISEEALTQLCITSNIQKNIIDWTHTGLVLNTKCKPLSTKKAILNRIFDRGYLHANMLARGLYGEVPDFVKNNRHNENSRIWIHNDKRSHCQMCDSALPETQEHILAICNNMETIEMRHLWLKEVLEHTNHNIQPLHALFSQQLRINSVGALTWQGCTKKASLIMSGCVLKEWWEHIETNITKNFDQTPTISQRDTMDTISNAFEKFLAWHGTHLKKRIWTTLHTIRSKTYVKRGDKNEDIAITQSADTVSASFSEFARSCKFQQF